MKTPSDRIREIIARKDKWDRARDGMPRAFKEVGAFIGALGLALILFFITAKALGWL